MSFEVTQPSNIYLFKMLQNSNCHFLSNMAFRMHPNWALNSVYSFEKLYESRLQTKLRELMLEGGKIFCCVYLWDLFWSKLNRQDKQSTQKTFLNSQGPRNLEEILCQKMLIHCFTTCCMSAHWNWNSCQLPISAIYRIKLNKNSDITKQ